MNYEKFVIWFQVNMVVFLADVS